jgi:hypothetical protein
MREAGIEEEICRFVENGERGSDYRFTRFFCAEEPPLIAIARWRRIQ